MMLLMICFICYQIQKSDWWRALWSHCEWRTFYRRQSQRIFHSNASSSGLSSRSEYCTSWFESTNSQRSTIMKFVLFENNFKFSSSLSDFVFLFNSLRIFYWKVKIKTSSKYQILDCRVYLMKVLQWWKRCVELHSMLVCSHHMTLICFGLFFRIQILQLSKMTTCDKI